jgi:hypothetical protein
MEKEKLVEFALEKKIHNFPNFFVEKKKRCLRDADETMLT